MSKRNYLEYVDSRMEREENKGRSFTYGNAMYDGIKERHFSFDDLDIEYEVNSIVEDESGAHIEWVENLEDEAKAEILDISILDELGRQIQETVDEEDKEDIFDELDGIEEFNTRKEFEERVKEAIEECGNSNLNWREIAEEYEDNNLLVILEEQEEK